MEQIDAMVCATMAPQVPSEPVTTLPTPPSPDAAEPSTAEPVATQPPVQSTGESSHVYTLLIMDYTNGKRYAD